MVSKEESNWKLERDTDRAQVTITLEGEYLNEIPDPVVISFAGQALVAAAKDMGAEPGR